MQKIVSIGIICLLLITGSISATCISLDNNNSEKSILSDPEPPVTEIGYDSVTGMVTIIAWIYPGNSELKAIYYKIDGGTTQTYSEPFFIGEGTHEIEFWSEDMAGNVESHKTRTYTYDSKPPTVEIIHPMEGRIYLFGSLIVKRLFRDTAICIGKLNISVNAYDDGVGVSSVLFTYGNETGYDNDGSDGWTDTNGYPHFGQITISVRAVDEMGHISEPVQREVIVYSLGL